jgi:hypothetical protein
MLSSRAVFWPRKGLARPFDTFKQVEVEVLDSLYDRLNGQELIDLGVERLYSRG